MFKPRPERISFLLGLYLSISVVLLSAGLLGWSYRTSAEAIDRELEYSFRQRHATAEIIMDGRMALIRHELAAIVEDDTFHSFIEKGMIMEAAETAAAMEDPGTGFQLDILVIRSVEGRVRDGSSPFFDTGGLAPLIAARSRELVSGGRILRLVKGDADLTVMLRGERIVEKESGRVAGDLIGGIVLNGNLSLVEHVRQRTEADSAAFFSGGALIAGTDLLTAPAVEILRRTGTEAGKVHRGGGFLAACGPVSLEGRKGPLSIAIAVSDSSLIELQYSYMRKGLVLFAVLPFFLVFTFYAINRLTVVSLKKLLDYSSLVSSGNLGARYEPGRIIEFNRIGRAMEEMVAELEGINERLGQSERKFRAIFDQTFQLSGLLSKEGIVIEVNNAALAFVDTPVEALIGLPFWETPWWEGEPEARERLKAAIGDAAKGKFVRFEAVHPAINGEKRIFDFSLKPVLDESGEVVFLIPEGRDITELKRAQDNLEALNARLEEMVRVRTEELTGSLESLKSTQKQLVESEKMASLGGMVAGIAHEINTPLGIGITSISFIGDRCKNITALHEGGKMTRSDFERFLKDTEESTSAALFNLRKAGELIQSFKQVSVDQTTETPRRFNLKAYLEEVVLSLAPNFRRKGHSVTVEGNGDLVLDSYPGAIMQIVTNLVMNSVIHGFEEKRAGEISIGVSESDGVVLLRYGDNGRGMDTEEKVMVFEPFFTTRRTRGGTGLGMHIVYNLVSGKLGGTIECQSTPGSGTVFIIQIPLKPLGPAS